MSETSPPATPVIVTIGNPNTGKSTLFNCLTGLRQKVSNYPGVTVEQVSGTARLADREVRFVDVPGTYSLAARSPDEMIAVDVLHGDVDALERPDLVLAVVDASNLRRNLFLLTQVMEADLPVVVALNMVDRLDDAGIALDVEALAARLGVPVVPVAAAENQGIEALRTTLAEALASPRRARLAINPALDEATVALTAQFGGRESVQGDMALRRALIDVDGHAESRLVQKHGAPLTAALDAARKAIGGGRSLATMEARDRYSWIGAVLAEVETRGEAVTTWRDRLDTWLNHPLIGTATFVAVMAMVFQAVFAWATPLVDGIDYLTGALGGVVGAGLGDGLLASFVTDGVIAGVGAVVVFLPQILILFLFIIVLEDSGYMARAAFLMDRMMRGLGLSGQSFIPMLSSFACAVPGIMGTRIIAGRRDRLATIAAAPFMTCSARLPVYSLLIAAFIPDERVLAGLFNTRGLVLLGLYLLGIAGGAFTAWLVGKLLRSQEKARFMLEMPPYRMPALRAVTSKLLSRVMIFLKRAGTIIFAVALLVWLLASFPRVSIDAGDGSAASAAPPIAESYLGRMSRSVAPLFTPLGWDWKVTASVIASFPAREVVIAALGTIYAVDAADDDTAGLTARIREARHDDGRLVYTLPMVIGLLIFFAFCLQCTSTMAVMWRETGSWRWPAVAWFYMTGLGYLFALAVFQLGTRL